MDLSRAEMLMVDCGLSRSRVEALLEFHRCSTATGFSYPWSDLESALEEAGNKPIYLVGYGSLLNPKSAGRSVANTPEQGHAPVAALGARRVFNYQIPESVFARYGIPPVGRGRAALNAEPMNESAFNGRLIELKSGDLPALRTREVAYDLRPVSCIYWDRSDAAPFSAFALCCPHEYWDGQRYLDNTLLPYPPYSDLCRAGAAMVSEQFLQFYLETTYLADRQTTAGQYETALRENPA